MTQALSLFLSRLASDYSQGESVPDGSALVQATIAVVKESKPRQAPAVKVEPRLTIPVPMVGSLDALGFRQAMKEAGMRRVDGRPVFQPHEVRDDQIKAIAAFIGFDPKENFGSQELRARMKSISDLRPVVAGDRKIPLTIKGYSVGMPDPVGKKRADLQGRERMAVEAIAEHEKLASEATTDDQRGEHQAYVLLERERLAAIRNDLEAMG